MASIALHLAALAALGGAVYAHRDARPPVAKVEIQNQPPSAPARAEMRPAPEVESEDPRDANPLAEVEVVLPEPKPPEPERAPYGDPLPPPPSAALDKIASERLRRPRPAPPAEPAPELPVETPADQAPQQQESEPVYTSASRSDRGGPPAYPDKERRLGREGTVVLRVYVEADGAVADVALKTPSRYAGFNRAALRAARGWRFDAATRGGLAVASETDVEVLFRLTDLARPRR
jgi:protein TonB